MLTHRTLCSLFFFRGAEDKFPILLYCLLKANPPHLYSELNWVKEFADPVVLREEAQYRLIELEQVRTYLVLCEQQLHE